ncbi:MAG TPA: T9SS type A sorting domain-containing protein, partial [Bacteroides sp.]|nr:T9SS type A sorting domain-containing protein [Bacteroides sp.]
YTSIVQDWFGASDESLIKTGFNDWVDKKLPLLTISGTGPSNQSGVNGLVVYPNPVQDRLNMYFHLEKMGGYSISIMNTEGRILKQESHQGSYGRNNLSTDLGDLPEGVYVLQLKYGQTLSSSRFLKIR